MYSIKILQILHDRNLNFFTIKYFYQNLFLLIKNSRSHYIIKALRQDSIFNNFKAISTRAGRPVPKPFFIKSVQFSNRFIGSGFIFKPVLLKN